MMKPRTALLGPSVKLTKVQRTILEMIRDGKGGFGSRWWTSVRLLGERGYWTWNSDTKRVLTHAGFSALRSSTIQGGGTTGKVLL